MARSIVICESEGGDLYGHCSKHHKKFLYYCQVCHDEWAAENPERAAYIKRLAGRLQRDA